MFCCPWVFSLPGMVSSFPWMVVFESWIVQCRFHIARDTVHWWKRALDYCKHCMHRRTVVCKILYHLCISCRISLTVLVTSSCCFMVLLRFHVASQEKGLYLNQRIQSCHAWMEILEAKTVLFLISQVPCKSPCCCFQYTQWWLASSSGGSVTGNRPLGFGVTRPSFPGGGSTEGGTLEFPWYHFCVPGNLSRNETKDGVFVSNTHGISEGWGVVFSVSFEVGGRSWMVRRCLNSESKVIERDISNGIISEYPIIYCLLLFLFHVFHFCWIEPTCVDLS